MCAARCRCRARSAAEGSSKVEPDRRGARLPGGDLLPDALDVEVVGRDALRGDALLRLDRVEGVDHLVEALLVLVDGLLECADVPAHLLGEGDVLAAAGRDVPGLELLDHLPHLANFSADVVGQGLAVAGKLLLEVLQEVLHLLLLVREGGNVELQGCHCALRLLELGDHDEAGAVLLEHGVEHLGDLLLNAALEGVPHGVELSPQAEVELAGLLQAGSSLRLLLGERGAQSPDSSCSLHEVVVVDALLLDHRADGVLDVEVAGAAGANSLGVLERDGHRGR